MEALQLKVALRILDHARIYACLVGELALNYYNVPRVLHVSITAVSILRPPILNHYRTLNYVS